MALLAENCFEANSWICGQYLSRYRSDILSALGQHVTLTVESLLLGVVISLPLVLLVRRSRRLTSLLENVSTALYTVPSLAMFAVLVPITGIGAGTVLIALVLYSLTVLVRNALAGLAAVPPDVVEAARGMGMSARRILFTVELPLALPTFFAGLRVAAVSTVALLTVGGLIGEGGLGNLIYIGLQSFFKAQVLVASVLCVLLAIALDVVIVGVEKVLTPWTRGVAA